MLTPSTPRGRALVTGCSSGFGLLTAVALARAGFAVTASMRNLDKRGALDAAARQAGVTLDVVALDVTDHAAVARVVADLEAGGGVALLVNNAGSGVLGALEDTSMDELREMFETNFFGPAALCKAVLPGMRERRRGRILNISSVGGRVGTACATAYSASKFALEGLSESLRREVVGFGIDVVLIEPGAYPTPMVGANRVMEAAKRPDSPYRRTIDAIEKMFAQISKDGPDPREVAELVARVATTRSPAPRYGVGRDARMLLTMQALLPERAFDWIQVQMFEKLMSSTHGG